MLTNFIYAKSKAMFEERIAEVPNDAIVFIEDTKEIWTHGTYFDCSSLDPNIIPNIQIAIDELRTKVENNNIVPDWNAQKGEAGYIENRPFERKNIEPFIYDDEVVYEDFSDIDIYIQCYDSIYSFPVGYNDDGLFIENEKEIYIPENSVSIKVRRYEYEMRIQSLNSELDVNDIPSLITVFYVDRKLNQSDIDNTVLKITPQELSNTDKNQALTNLGIDPVVWKYIMNPFVLQTGRIVPDELIASDGVSFKYPYAGMYRWAKGYAYDKDNFEYYNSGNGDFGSVHCPYGSMDYRDGSIYGAGNEIPPEGLPTSSSVIDDTEGPYCINHNNYNEWFTTGTWLIDKDTKQCYLAV